MFGLRYVEGRSSIYRVTFRALMMMMMMMMMMMCLFHPVDFPLISVDEK